MRYLVLLALMGCAVEAAPCDPQCTREPSERCGVDETLITCACPQSWTGCVELAPEQACCPAVL
jgi:hypothetical protein